VVRIFGVFDNKQIAVFNEGLLIYQERMDGNTHLLNQAEYGRGRRGCKVPEEHKQNLSKLMTGELHPNFQGISVGTNRTTGQIIVFDGKKSMKDRAFFSHHVSACISGTRPHHKNFTFIRTTDEEFLLQLLEEDNFHDEQSRQILQNYLER
jgi:hypothetical protein